MPHITARPLTASDQVRLRDIYENLLHQLATEYGPARITRSGTIECVVGDMRVEVSEMGYSLPFVPPSAYSVTVCTIDPPTELQSVDDVHGIPMVIAEARELLRAHSPAQRAKLGVPIPIRNPRRAASHLAAAAVIVRIAAQTDTELQLAADLDAFATELQLRGTR